MKKLLFLFILFGLWACTHDERSQLSSHIEYLPIDSATLPVQFKRDSIYEIPLQYIRPSTCHLYEGLYYAKNSNIRTIAVVTSVLEQDNCTVAPINPLTVTLSFKPTTESSYVIRLWKGKDASGQNIYQDTTIPVVP